jgi:hypothetical protein
MGFQAHVYDEWHSDRPERNKAAFQECCYSPDKLTSVPSKGLFRPMPRKNSMEYEKNQKQQDYMEEEKGRYFPLGHGDSVFPLIGPEENCANYRPRMLTTSEKWFSNYDRRGRTSCIGKKRDEQDPIHSEQFPFSFVYSCPLRRSSTLYNVAKTRHSEKTDQYRFCSNALKKNTRWENAQKDEEQELMTEKSTLSHMSTNKKPSIAPNVRIQGGYQLRNSTTRQRNSLEENTDECHPFKRHCPSLNSSYEKVVKASSHSFKKHESSFPLWSYHRCTCHHCGNLRDYVWVCPCCQQAFCGHCVGRYVQRFDTRSIFGKDGCPFCQSICCCRGKRIVGKGYGNCPLLLKEQHRKHENLPALHCIQCRKHNISHLQGVSHKEPSKLGVSTLQEVQEKLKSIWGEWLLQVCESSPLSSHKKREPYYSWCQDIFHEQGLPFLYHIGKKKYQ